jgi:glutamine synthetase
VTKAKPESATSKSWLAGEVSAGRVDTVALSFADRLGTWRGKRVPARDFVEHGPVVLGFCDGMVVCDIRCGVIEETPFSNFSTGYPDLHVTLDPRDARPTGWRPGEAFVFGVPSDHHGVALEVAPTAVLASVVARFAESGAGGDGAGVAVTCGAELSGAFFDRDRRPLLASISSQPGDLPIRLLDALVDSWIPARYVSPGFDAGSFVIGIDQMPPLELALSMVVAKGAAKELARADGNEAVFMTRRPGGVQPALLELDISLDTGFDADAGVVSGLLADARPLLFPSVNAMRVSSVSPPSSEQAGARWRVVASAEADAATALAVSLAAIGAARDGVQPSGMQVDDLSRSATLLENPWLCDWLGKPLLENAVALFEHEARLFSASVTDWEIERYWGVA